MEDGAVQGKPQLFQDGQEHPAKKKKREERTAKSSLQVVKLKLKIPVIQGQVTVGVTIHQPPEHRVYKM